MAYQCNDCNNWIADNSGKHECYYKKLEKENKKLREALTAAKRMFTLILVPPIEVPKTAHEFESLWERDKRDAKNGIRDIDEVLK